MIYLFGHGYVANAIAKQLPKAVRLRHTQLYSLVANDSDIIINAAGFTGSPNVDACEDFPNLCLTGNVIFPYELELHSNGAPVIHVGSGCIYNSPYTSWRFHELDVPNFIGSLYSISKITMEHVLKPFLHKSYILRIRIPFSQDKNPRNYLTKIRQYPKLISVQNSLTCLEDFADCVKFFCEKRPKPGIYNATNPGTIDAKEIAERMQIAQTKEWITLHDLEKMVRVPRSNCHLDTHKLHAVFKMRPIAAAIAASLL